MADFTGAMGAVNSGFCWIDIHKGHAIYIRVELTECSNEMQYLVEGDEEHGAELWKFVFQHITRIEK